jgi:hypothetical protein
MVLLSAGALQRRLLSGFLSGTPLPDLVEAYVQIVAQAFMGPLEDVGFVDLTDIVQAKWVDEQVNAPSFAPWTSRGRHRLLARIARSLRNGSSLSPGSTMTSSPATLMSIRRSAGERLRSFLSFPIDDLDKALGIQLVKQPKQILLVSYGLHLVLPQEKLDDCVHPSLLLNQLSDPGGNSIKAIVGPGLQVQNNRPPSSLRKTTSSLILAVDARESCSCISDSHPSHTFSNGS